MFFNADTTLLEKLNNTMMHDASQRRRGRFPLLPAMAPQIRGPKAGGGAPSLPLPCRGSYTAASPLSPLCPTAAACLSVRGPRRRGGAPTQSSGERSILPPTDLSGDDDEDPFHPDGSDKCPAGMLKM